MDWHINVLVHCIGIGGSLGNRIGDFPVVVALMFTFVT
jgi:hypothetical protein